MKFQTPVQVWFLDEDLTVSARYMTNEALDKSIRGAVAVLLDAIFYASGIRTKKAYEFYFSRDKRDETIDRVFPGWPFRKQPAMKYYTSRTSRWARQCGEHFEYMFEYLDIMLAEYESRKSRRHQMAGFSDWLAGSGFGLPKANLKTIALPWKALKKRFRRKDIIEGYRLQYCWSIPEGDVYGAYKNTERDIPDFVIKHFGLDMI